MQYKLNSLLFNFIPTVNLHNTLLPILFNHQRRQLIPFDAPTIQSLGVLLNTERRPGIMPVNDGHRLRDPKTFVLCRQRRLVFIEELNKNQH